jgi:hypothetical protein
MKYRNLALTMTLLATTACAQSDADGADKNAIPAASPTEIAAGAATTAVSRTASSQAPASMPKMVVHKSASCGCCGLWVDHMRHAGFEVEVRNEDNLNPIKEALGVPYGKGSCHTAEVAGYVIEGHVPAEDIQRLLTQKPDARGLLLPGMPAGSPGMEMPDGRVQPYAVELVAKDGSTSVFSRHGEGAPQAFPQR